MQRVVFMGTPDYATTILKGLLRSNDFEVVGVFTQEDKKVGRKQILTPPHIKKYILDNDLDIPIFQPKRLSEVDANKNIKSLKPDFIVVAAYGQILPLDILNIAPCINLHASILPKYRGASPIQDAIKNMEKYSGVTAMKMEEGLDCGDILGISYIKIDGMDAPSLFDKLSILASELSIKVLKEYENICAIKQNELKTNYSKKITKSDGLVVLDDAKKVYAKYLAYIFWPGIFLESGLKLKEISLLEDSSKNKGGEILSIEKEFIVVGCKKGTLKIKQVQPSSKKQMNVLDYIRGKRLGVGDSLF